MRSWNNFRKLVSFFVVVLATGACGGGHSDPSLEWEQAQEMWRTRDNMAYQVWMDYDEDSSSGQKARKRLGVADVFYKNGIGFFKSGDDDKASENLEKGAQVAPINPAYYVELARIYRDRGFVNIAADYYLKTMQSLPDSEVSKTASTEYQKLAQGINPELVSVFDPPKNSSKDNNQGSLMDSSFNLFIAFVLGLLVAMAAFLVLWMKRSPGVSLTRLIDEAPELHSAIAYLIGSVRHELLKHRMGAISDVVKALTTGSGSQLQLEFLKDRLYGGVPINDAWNAQKIAFRRALGVRLNLLKDKAFVDADSAFMKIMDMQPELGSPNSNLASDLALAHRQLRDFDGHLAQQQKKLVRTRVDDELFDQVVGEVGGEYAVSGVVLDELSVEPTPPDVYIEVPRDDLILILKNILRNAIMAVEREGQEKRVGFRVELSLEPTGQEVVAIGLRDTGARTFFLRDLDKKDKGEGLKLVTTAVKRYGGAMDVVPCTDVFNKEVVVRFFRVFEDDTA